MDEHSCEKKQVAINESIIKAIDLISYGKKKMNDLNLSSGAITDNCRQENCIGSNIHRGFYHPSPVYDIIMGNSKRGKLSSSLDNSGLSCCYSFDHFGKLKYAQDIFLGSISRTEYLFYEENRCMGVTVDCYGHLCAVSEEIYDCDILRSFSLANCHFLNNDYSCFLIRCEHYDYDPLGLSACKFRVLSPGSGHLIDKYYSFERNNGFLVSYTDVSTGGVNSKSPIYPIRKKRRSVLPVLPTFSGCCSIKDPLS